MKRRDFIQIFSAGAWATSMYNIGLNDIISGNFHKLTILHTNDWHSRIEPFPMDGSRNQGLGGASKRAAMINRIRQEEKNVLLFDSGDIFQGTPYFNFYSGELEFKLMSEMGYDAATLGNHDFDGGLENLGHQMKHADFPFVCSNYTFTDLLLKEKVLPYKILKRDDIKIGVFGLGIELNGLVPESLYGDTKYSDPLTEANRVADYLKKTKKCDLVVCLSHLGYKYRSDRISDVVIAQKSKNIDLILGGHTHTFMKEAASYKNQDGKAVLVNQVGWAGILLGRIDFYLEKTSGWRWRKGSSEQIA